MVKGFPSGGSDKLYADRQQPVQRGGVWVPPILVPPHSHAVSQARMQLGLAKPHKTGFCESDQGPLVRATHSPSAEPGALKAVGVEEVGGLPGPGGARRGKQGGRGEDKGEEGAARHRVGRRRYGPPPLMSRA